MAEERAREQQRRREEARLAEARREAAEEARRRQAQQHQQQQQQQQQQQKQRRQALREERQRQERIQRAREIANAWRTYEGRWALLSQRQPELGLLSALTFERIPWPVADVPQGRTLDMLQPEAIREFLLSPAHSPDVSSKDRIRAALRRWHPDKFTRVLNQVMESDRTAVEEGMGVVVRCLNDMLEKDHQARD
jgi:flagellar biosynthesis GTPase FlhF